MELDAVGLSLPGAGASRQNEDAFLVDLDLGLLAVADGLGGRAAGDVASRLALSALAAELRRGPRPATLSELANAVEAANAAVWERANDDARCSGMGTTLTACLIVDHRALFGHVGDSSGFLVRGGKMVRVTQSHTVGALRELQGKAVPGETRRQEKRLLCSLGTSPWAHVDTFEQPLLPSDLLLLCTDGVTDRVPLGELLGAVVLPEPLDVRLGRLLAAARECGATDDTTAVLGALR